VTLRRGIAAACVASVGLAGALLAGAAWLGSSQALRPPWYQHRTPEQGLAPMDPADEFFVWQGGYRDPQADLGLDFETVELPARDGSVLRGWWVPGQPGATAGVVAVHGAGADRREFLRQVPLLHGAGYPVVLFDCREHGMSDGAARGVSLGIRESEDVTAVVGWAKQMRGLERVAVLGTSQGAASVILAAAADPSIDVVIAENPYTSVRDLFRDLDGLRERPSPVWLVDLVAATALWRVGGLGRPAPIEVVGAIAPRPLLLMHGTRDQAIPWAHSERLRAAAGEPVELWILEGGEHAALFNHAPDEWRRRVLGFLARWLGPALPAALPSRPGVG
jgi:alpha-beta hydrolase superfamily lysophospholipase